jgi:hypothetical protein
MQSSRRSAVLMRRVVTALAVLLACATPRPPGEPMKSTCPATIELPTVEECREAASVITNELLYSCVKRQCSDITVQCTEESRRRCKLYNSQGAGRTVLAYTLFTYYGTINQFFPVKETFWCEEPASRECIAKAVIHELAHSCGWHHGQGQNVPGNDESAPIPECQCVMQNGDPKSCQ